MKSVHNEGKYIFRGLALKVNNEHVFRKYKQILTDEFGLDLLITEKWKCGYYRVTKNHSKCQKSKILMNIVEWNNYIERNCVMKKKKKFNEEHVRPHVHCYNCEKCCFDYKNPRIHFKRCSSCKILYFCSPKCKNAQHVKHCKERGNLFDFFDLETISIDLIYMNEKKQLIYPVTFIKNYNSWLTEIYDKKLESLNKILSLQRKLEK